MYLNVLEIFFGWTVYIVPKKPTKNHKKTHLVFGGFVVEICVTQRNNDHEDLRFSMVSNHQEIASLNGLVTRAPKNLP